MPSHTNWNQQFVWPRDSHKGRSRRGILHRLKDIFTNRGPDIFVQPKNSRMPVKLDEWSNWDSYHYWDSHMLENDPKLPKFCSRGTKRYDPHTRKYVSWDLKEDWLGVRQRYSLTQRKEVTPAKKSRPGCHSAARPEYDWFWDEAHRAGENLDRGRHPYEDPSPRVSYRQKNFPASQDIPPRQRRF